MHWVRIGRADFLKIGSSIGSSCIRPIIGEKAQVSHCCKTGSAIRSLWKYVQVYWLTTNPLHLEVFAKSERSTRGDWLLLAVSNACFEWRISRSERIDGIGLSWLLVGISSCCAALLGSSDVHKLDRLVFALWCVAMFSKMIYTFCKP